MKLATLFLFLSIALAAKAQEFFDRLDDSLAFSFFANNVRARFSGTLDLEAYSFQEPAPALIDSGDNFLFNPRLTLFLDAQAGSTVYFFGQARIDRGFDPGDHNIEARLDEYAVRVTPWKDGWLSIQFGKFATVVGTFALRHLSWDNPFVTAPLVYENPTALKDETGE